jgi:YidC/Oxa1 family membrane protein insertase
VQNLTAAPLRLDFPLILGVLDFHKDQAQARYQDVAVALKDKTLHLNGRKDMAFEEIKFLGLRDRYFCAIIEPQSPGWRGFINKINNQESQIGLNPPEIVLPVGQSIKQNFRIYLGPQELKYINAIKPEWTAIIHYGTFDFIAQLILQVLEALYRLVHNWGWAIIILSIGIYLLLFPLSLKQMHSMKKMQALQPEIEELRRIYKDNPQKLNKEIMELYRRNKANPFAGCLPLILQMPIFFALYQVLMRSVSLKGAVFLWIKDLSEPDRLFQLPFTMPILGNEVNILPILMAIGMFVQQKFSLANTSSGSAEQQKMMMIIMPIMFGFIFYRMPAGLVLYWFVNSLFMLIYQIRISRTK